MDKQTRRASSVATTVDQNFLRVYAQMICFLSNSSRRRIIFSVGVIPEQAMFQIVK
jgi:hypothetical protein